jgi:uncharacterized membrane protein YdbT with pleckstrin-like domain
METPPLQKPQVIDLRPATLFAFIKVFPFIILTIVFLLLAGRYWPGLLFVSLICVVMACYRFIYIRNIRYTLTPEILRLSRGIFFKRVDQVELYRLKDYIVIRPFLLQIFGLMDVELKGTDPENPIVWLRGIPYSDLVDTIRNHVQHARAVNKIYEIE